MAEQSKALRKPAPKQAAGIKQPRLEQLLSACGGYVAAQLAALILIKDPGDEDLLFLGIAGASIGVVVHVLIRGVGIRLPGVGKRFRIRVSKAARTPSVGRKFSDRKDRVSRYRTALNVFRRPFARRGRKSEAPGNEEKIVETANGFRVGDRVFSRRAQAEDFLYVGDSPAGRGGKHDQARTPATRHSRRIRWSKSRVLNTVALAFAFLIAAIVVFSSYS